MNLKTFNIWKALLANPGVEMSVQSIAYQVNLTTKQAFAIVNTLPRPPVEFTRYHTPDCTVVCARFAGGPEEAEAMMREVVSRRYNVTAEMKEAVSGTLSVAGWMTLGGLADATGMTRNEVYHTVCTLPDVAVKTADGTNLYSRRKS